jgi:hypothetical protein
LLQLACAGIMVRGDNAGCPAGSFRIVDFAQCEILASNAGLRSYPLSPTNDDRELSGCVQKYNSEWLFNTHPTGGCLNNQCERWNGLMLCASAGPRARCDACACASACVRVLRVLVVCEHMRRLYMLKMLDTYGMKMKTCRIYSARTHCRCGGDGAQVQPPERYGLPCAPSLPPL